MREREHANSPGEDSAYISHRSFNKVCYQISQVVHVLALVMCSGYHRATLIKPAE